MYCKNCGKTVDASDKSCANCGTTNSPPISIPSPTEPLPNTKLSLNAFKLRVNTTKPPADNKSKSTPGWQMFALIMLAVAVAVLIVTGGPLIRLYFKSLLVKSIYYLVVIGGILACLGTIIKNGGWRQNPKLSVITIPIIAICAYIFIAFPSLREGKAATRVNTPSAESVNQQLTELSDKINKNLPKMTTEYTRWDSRKGVRDNFQASG